MTGSPGFNIILHGMVMKAGLQTPDGKRVPVEAALKDPHIPLKSLREALAKYALGYDDHGGGPGDVVAPIEELVDDDQYRQLQLRLVLRPESASRLRESDAMPSSQRKEKVQGTIQEIISLQ